MNCRQATHPIFTCFLGSREEPPGGERCAARRRVTDQPRFWVFAWTAWRWWKPARQRRPILVQFWCFECSDWIL